MGLNLSQVFVAEFMETSLYAPSELERTELFDHVKCPGQNKNTPTASRMKKAIK